MSWKTLYNFYWLKKVSRPNRDFRQALWQNLSTEFEKLYPQPVFVWSYARLIKYSAAVLVLVLLSSTIGAGAYAFENPTVNESHWLYPLKRGVEKVEEKMTRTAGQKAVFNLKQMHRRQAEINALAEEGSPAPVASVEREEAEKAGWQAAEDVTSEEEQGKVIEEILEEHLRAMEDVERHEAKLLEKMEKQTEDDSDKKELINPSPSGQEKVREDSGRGRSEEKK